MGDIPEPWPDDPRPPDGPPLEPPIPHDPPRLPGQEDVQAPDIGRTTPPRVAGAAGRTVPDEDVVASDQTSDGVPSEPPD